MRDCWKCFYFSQDLLWPLLVKNLVLTPVPNVPKGQIKSELIYEVIDFPNYQLKNLKDFCPESYKVEYLQI